MHLSVVAGRQKCHSAVQQVSYKIILIKVSEGMFDISRDLYLSYAE